MGYRASEKKWKPEYIDFDIAIQKLKQNDRTFIDFDTISVFDSRKVYEVLRQKKIFFRNGLS